jgi:glutathione peroxidase-family protein
MQTETKKELERLKRLGEHYGKDGFAVYSAFTYDVQGGDDFNNRDIANFLTQWGYLSTENINSNMRFISKLDVNGKEMHNLYKFLKRQSPLFIHKYGRARRINEYYNKFLTDRYGEVKHYYGPKTEYAVIEADIRRLLEEKFYEKKY